jgi:hypothetical protein
MVAFADGMPIGVLIGAKRPGGTLIHRIAVHPDHLRQGHGRHLLASLSSKLAILGPPRMIAEVPESLSAARGLFRACGYEEEVRLTDYALQEASVPASAVPGFLIPISVDDLAGNGLLADADPHVCWERSVETLRARKETLRGLAVASDEGIEAYLLYDRDTREIALLRSLIDDGGARLRHLLSRLADPGVCRFPKVHPAEVPESLLESLGFRAAGVHLVYGALARSG